MPGIGKGELIIPFMIYGNEIFFYQTEWDAENGTSIYFKNTC